MYFLGGILSVCFNIVFVLCSCVIFSPSLSRFTFRVKEKQRGSMKVEKTMQRTFRMCTIISLKAKRRIRVQ